MEIWAYTLGSVLIVSLIPLIGFATLLVRPQKLAKLVVFLVSFAAGGLFGDALIHLLPEAFEDIGSSLKVSLLTAGGLLIFFVLEKFLRWRHCHLPTSKTHPHPVATMNLIGDGVHNFIDGLLIGASYSVGIPLGVTTSVAVILHEVPQEMGDFGVLIHGGYSIKRALTFNLLAALTAFLGALLVLALGSRVAGLPLALLPITAGGFLYIAGSDLIPELQHECDLKTSLMQLGGIILGLMMMVLLALGE